LQHLTAFQTSCIYIYLATFSKQPTMILSSRDPNSLFSIHLPCHLLSQLSKLCGSLISKDFGVSDQLAINVQVLSINRKDFKKAFCLFLYRSSPASTMSSTHALFVPRRSLEARTHLLPGPTSVNSQWILWPPPVCHAASVLDHRSYLKIPNLRSNSFDLE
jgi:hypothetical protein